MKIKIILPLFLFIAVCVNAQTTSEAFVEEPAMSSAFLDSLEMVTVGNPYNPPDNQGLGSVGSTFQIGKYKVTVEQYAAFLNAVASHQDIHYLYDERMQSDANIACLSIIRQLDGTVHYQAIQGREKFPITYVSLQDAERFCNWLEHGAPENIADEKVESITEDGAYHFTPAESGNEERVTSNLQAHYRLPTEDEWLKAAYYKPQKVTGDFFSPSSYWLYPTSSNIAPSNNYGDLKNQANYQSTYSLWNVPMKQPVLKAVDFFKESKSPFGCYDMGGNAAEWTSTEYSTISPIALGGSWKSQYSFYEDNDLMRTSLRKSYNPTDKTNFIGFRVVFSDFPNAPATSISLDLDELVKASHADILDFLKSLLPPQETAWLSEIKLFIQTVGSLLLLTLIILAALDLALIFNGSSSKLTWSCISDAYNAYSSLNRNIESLNRHVASRNETSVYEGTVIEAISSLKKNINELVENKEANKQIAEPTDSNASLLTLAEQTLASTRRLIAVESRLITTIEETISIWRESFTYNWNIVKKRILIMFGIVSLLIFHPAKLLFSKDYQDSRYPYGMHGDISQMQN